MNRSSSIPAMVLFALTSCAPAAPPPKNDGGRAVMEAYVQAWNRHDTLGVDTLLAPAGVHEDVAQGVRAVGGAQVNAFMREVYAVEPDFDWQLTKVMTDGPRIAAEWTLSATYTGPSPNGPVTKLRIAGRGVSLVDFENGKIKQLTDYYDIGSFFPPPAKEPARK